MSAAHTACCPGALFSEALSGSQPSQPSPSHTRGIKQRYGVQTGLQNEPQPQPQPAAATHLVPATCSAAGPECHTPARVVAPMHAFPAMPVGDCRQPKRSHRCTNRRMHASTTTTYVTIRRPNRTCRTATQHCNRWHTQATVQQESNSSSQHSRHTAARSQEDSNHTTHIEPARLTAVLVAGCCPTAVTGGTARQVRPQHSSTNTMCCSPTSADFPAAAANDAVGPTQYTVLIGGE
jgi:hypothetical protein